MYSEGGVPAYRLRAVSHLLLAVDIVRHHRHKPHGATAKRTSFQSIHGVASIIFCVGAEFQQRHDFM